MCGLRCNRRIRSCTPQQWGTEIAEVLEHHRHLRRSADSSGRSAPEQVTGTVAMLVTAVARGVVDQENPEIHEDALRGDVGRAGRRRPVSDHSLAVTLAR